MSVRSRSKRILIVSYWFPPFDAVASVRMGKLAKHLLDRGWDVRVLAADATNPDTLAVEIPRKLVVYTPWTEVDRYIENMLGSFSALVRRQTRSPAAATASATATAEPERKGSKLRALARRAIQEISRWPDNRAGWLAPALAGGEALFRSWRPDLIYATSPPVTSLIVADRLARRHAVPWIAEFRDLWTDHPYYEYSPLRRWFERIWEHRVLRRAAALVSVSPTWQPKLAARYGRPTIVAMNGFVASDFPQAPPLEPERSGPLRIVYTGHIYRGHRDPTPLFAALRALGAAPSDVIVEFVGTEVESLRELARGFGLIDHVRIRDPVSYASALDIQLRADVLLHLQWCDPKEEGTIAGKIFDYFGARRPILGIALEDSVVAKMVHERGAGLVTNDAAKIAKQVAAWMAEKRAGGIAPLPPTASEGLERAVQFAKIESLLSDVLAGAADPAGVSRLAPAG